MASKKASHFQVHHGSRRCHWHGPWQQGAIKHGELDAEALEKIKEALIKAQ